MPVYLKLGSVQGESKAKGHEGWIELMSASLGVTKKADKKDESGQILCMKAVDAASAALMRMSLDGDPVTATLDFVDAQGKSYFQLVLESVLITSYTVGSSRGDLGAMESFVMSFTKSKFVRLTTNAPFDLVTLFEDVADSILGP